MSLAINPILSALEVGRDMSAKGAPAAICHLLSAICYLRPEGPYARGNPNPRCAMMLRWISLVPPAIVEDTDET